MSTDDLPTDVLTELGRVTWAAINLEDYVKSLCSFIEPADPRTDHRVVSTKIKDAKKVLADWSNPSVRDEALAWLERAGQAIERRNAVLHATPLVWFEQPGQRGERRFFLGEMPRKGRSYVGRPLTVESLAELRSVLVGAAYGWRDLVIAVGTESQAAATRSG
jgi:hypothetical protein